MKNSVSITYKISFSFASVALFALMVYKFVSDNLFTYWVEILEIGGIALLVSYISNIWVSDKNVNSFLLGLLGAIAVIIVNILLGAQQIGFLASLSLNTSFLVIFLAGTISFVLFTISALIAKGVTKVISR